MVTQVSQDIQDSLEVKVSLAYHVYNAVFCQVLCLNFFFRLKCVASKAAYIS